MWESEVLAVNAEWLPAARAVITCSGAFPELAVNIPNLLLGSDAYNSALVKKFLKGRVPKLPKRPATQPDVMVAVVLQHYFGLKAAELTRLQEEHALAMGAENIVGDLLERYVAKQLEPQGWAWCSGASMRSVDFVKPPNARNRPWLLLQVKNRDNSENSSSSAIRSGTEIQKWHRSFSKKEGSNWAAFPQVGANELLTEKGFQLFAETYLKALVKR